MALGLGLMRLNPADFWALTPREFAAASRPFLGVAQPAAPALTRCDLETLIAAFPDRP